MKRVFSLLLCGLLLPCFLPAHAAETKAINATKESPWENSLGMKFVPVPGTSVLFSIWDVRVKDYRAYASAVGGVNTNWQNPGFNQTDYHPVVKMSWLDAQAFCQWLTQKERSEGKLAEGQSYRLPREVEWNVAVGNSKYPWGESWPPPSGAGNYDPSLGVDNYTNTSPVDSFRANQYGLYDMGGNVWQWCEDWYDGSQKCRVARGASWGASTSNYLLSSYRLNGYTPNVRHDRFGIRCVLVGGSAP
jgi:formylglycine-generating enzyme required for sulfatase activity